MTSSNPAGARGPEGAPRDPGSAGRAPAGHRAWAGAMVAYVVITLVIGRDVLRSIGSAVASDPGDPLLNAAILAWTAMVPPWTEAWYQFPIFHPTRDALLLSEHLLGASPIAAPLYWLTGNALVAYNVTLLVSYPLCGMAMYALVWHLTRSAGAAFLSGLAFAFAPYRAGQLPHIQVLLAWWMPLSLLALHRFVGRDPSAGTPAAGPSPEPAPLSEARADAAVPDPAGPATPTPSRGAGPAEGGPASPNGARHPVTWTRLLSLSMFAVCWLFQGASNGYFLVYFSLLVGLWLLWFAVARGRWRAALTVGAAMAIASLPLAPILSRYVSTQHTLGLSRNLGEMAAFSADIAAPLCAPAGLAFWGWLRVGCGPEGELFAGAGLVGLCLAGALWRLPAGRRGGASAARRGARAGLKARRDAASPRPLRRWVIRLAVAAALAYLGIAAGVALAGPWRLDLGWFRASASSIDKPATVAFVLLLAAALLSRRFSDTVRRGEASTFYLLAAAACWIFSWGPFPRLLGAEVLYQAPFAWLLPLPGVGGLRVPARFWMVAVLCLVVFMGIVAAHVLRGRRARWRAAFVTVAAGALLMDGWTRIPAARVPAAVPADAGLRGRTVAVLPIGDPARDAAVVYHAVTGGWRAINGYSGYEPVYYEALRTLAQDGDPRMLDPFRAHGDLVVVDSGTGSREVQRREPAPPTAVPRGTRAAVQAVVATCAPEAAALAHDGDLATAWVCGTQSADHALTADLGRVVSVGAIVHALGVSGSFFPRRLVVETSVDGAAWTEAWSGSPAYAVLEAARTAPREIRAGIAFPPRAARYIRLRQTGRHAINYWALAELEVWSALD